MKQFGCKTLSPVNYEYIRDKDKKLTNIKSGSRFVLVDPLIKENPLPRKTYCGNFACTIYHQGQKIEEKYCYNCLQSGHLKYSCKNERACRACKQPGHTEGEAECEYYHPNDVLTFKGKEDELSNYYPCSMNWKNTDMHCSEQAKLLESGDRLIAECVVSDQYWSCGLGKETAANADPAYWPGENMLGKIWMEMSYLMIATTVPMTSIRIKRIEIMMELVMYVITVQ